MILVPAFLIVGLTQFTPIPTVLVIGVAFSLVPAAIWPCVPILIDEKYTGTAFGLLSVFINSALTGAYPFMALIGYVVCVVCVVCVLCVLCVGCASFGVSKACCGLPAAIWPCVPILCDFYVATSRKVKLKLFLCV